MAADLLCMHCSRYFIVHRVKHLTIDIADEKSQAKHGQMPDSRQPRLHAYWMEHGIGASVREEGLGPRGLGRRRRVENAREHRRIPPDRMIGNARDFNTMFSQVSG